MIRESFGKASNDADDAVHHPEVFGVMRRIFGMTEGDDSPLFVFPRLVELCMPVIALAVFGGLLYVPTLITLGHFAANDCGRVFSHPAGSLQPSPARRQAQPRTSCCHFTVEKTAFASLPPTQVCMNCHTKIKPDSDKLAPVHELADGPAD